MTQATFDRYFLRYSTAQHGTAMEGGQAVSEPGRTGRLRRALLKSRIKRAFS
ncbi:hypothetical protein [Paraburkholderia sediminicola]|uniref:hypothetical protein n=1 Tax=Paraburkholderia sediminicola TaxID=458836 RepID=UPI0038BBCD87